MKAIINALAMELALIDMDPKAAKEFAERFVEENAELFQQVPIVRQGLAKPVGIVDLREPGQPLEEPTPDADGNLPRAVVHRVPVVGSDGLTNRQRDAVASGVGLCPNCQQPKNRHLPGCARASGEDKRAITKDPLPPVA